jgi:hypothetical protein
LNSLFYLFPWQLFDNPWFTPRAGSTPAFGIRNSFGLRLFKIDFSYGRMIFI